MLDQIAHCRIEVQARVAEVIASIEPGQVTAAVRPEPAPGEDRIELPQVEVHEEKGIAKGVLARCEAAMPNLTDIDRAGQSTVHSPTPNC